MSGEENLGDSEIRDEDTIKILLATDIHLGYEHTTKRLQESDSFITFEEILQHAQKLNADFILLGGDLFHDSKPTQKIIVQCMDLLRKYVMGDRTIEIAFLTEPKDIFQHTSNKGPNFEDPNINIFMPIFSIHGNHDNPSFESTGSMDILQSSGLVNYFGKWPDLAKISVPPMVIQKGETYVSIYGLSYINDQRLSRLLRDNQITLKRISGGLQPFNIFMLHQNRAKHTQNGYIPEDKLPAGIDLVLWGHEHECRIDPEKIENKTVDPPRMYHITQPGSSVATSLCPGEAKEKHIGLLEVNKRRFKLKPIKLETVRPFVFEDLHLRTVEFPRNPKESLSEMVQHHVDEYIEHILLPKVKKLITDNPNQPKVPLIRLRVFYTEEAQVFDVTKLSQRYADTVANPRDMVQFRKEKGVPDDKKDGFPKDIDDDDDGDMSECFRTNGNEDWSRTVQGGIRNYFAREKKKTLKVLSVAGLNEALKSFVETGDDDAFKNVVNHQAKKAAAYLKNFDVTEEADILEQLKVYRDERNKADGNGEEETEVRQCLAAEAVKNRKKVIQSNTGAGSDRSSDEAMITDDEGGAAAIPARGRGRGSRARARGTRGTTRGRGKAAAPARTSGLDVSFSSFAPKANSSTKPSKQSRATSWEDDDSD